MGKMIYLDNAATTKTAISVACAPRRRIEVNAS